MVKKESVFDWVVKIFKGRELRKIVPLELFFWSTFKINDFEEKFLENNELIL